MLSVLLEICVKKYFFSDQTLPIGFLIVEKVETVPKLEKLVHIACELIHVRSSGVPME